VKSKFLPIIHQDVRLIFRGSELVEENVLLKNIGIEEGIVVHSCPRMNTLQLQFNSYPMKSDNDFYENIEIISINDYLNHPFLAAIQELVKPQHISQFFQLMS